MEMLAPTPSETGAGPPLIVTEVALELSDNDNEILLTPNPTFSE